jgi:hypothetical protein
MKTETFTIQKNDLEYFYDACDEINNTNIIREEVIKSSNPEIAPVIITLEYKWDSNLFYLGQMFQLKKLLNNK